MKRVARIRTAVVIVVLAMAVPAMMLSGASYAADAGGYTWVWQNPLPNGHRMLSTSAASTSAVWSVGEYGDILFWNGSTLTEQNSGTTNNLYGVSAFNATNVWAVGEGGTILRYNGSVWAPQASPTTYDLISVSAADATHVWAVGGYDGFSNAVILFYNGTNWAVQQTYATGGLMDVFALNATNVWAVGQGGSGVGRTLKYNGTSWSEINTSRDPLAVSAYNVNNVWAVTWGGDVLSSINGGVDWTVQFTATWPASVCALNSTHIWVVGWNGTIQMWNGTTWVTQSNSSTRDIYDIDAVSNTRAYAGGDWRFSYYNGSTWTDRTGGPTAQIRYGVSGLDQDRVWTVGAGGAITYSSDGGKVWTSQASGVTSILRGVGALDATHVWAVGQSGVIRFFDGSTWGAQTSGVTGYLYGVKALDAAHVWAVGASGVIRFYNGSAWGPQTSGTTATLYGVSALDTTHAWTVGTSGVIRFYNGTVWGGQTSGTTQALYAVNALDATHVWAVGAAGTIRFFNGTSWTGQTSGTTNALYGVWAADANHVWAVGASGTILFYDGSSWTQQASGMTTNALYAAFACDANDAWAVGAGGTILFADPPYTKLCTPNCADPDETVPVEIVGGYTHFANPDPVLSVGAGVGVVPGSLNVVDNTHMTAELYVDPGAELGPRDVNVTTTGETPVPLEGGFAVGSNPMIASVSQAEVPRGWTGYVEVIGSQKAGNQTHFSSGSVAQFGPGIAVNSTQVSDETHVTANITVGDDAAAGMRDVNVTTPGETPAPLEGVFRIAAPPVIAEISPDSGEAGTEVTLTGTAFGDMRISGGVNPISTVTFNGAEVSDYVVWSDTELTCEVPESATSGPVVINAVGGASNEVVFTVTEPPPPPPPESATWFLAEGSSAWGFSTDISIMNPNDVAVTAKVTYMTTDGAVGRPDVVLPPESRTTINPVNDLGEKDFSTKVECPEGKTIAVDRTMSWCGPGGVGEGHSSVGVCAPATRWYLPEGSSNWGFECWLLIQNPGETAASCRVTYMIEGEAPMTVTRTVPPSSRATFNIVDDIGMKDASMMVESDVPVIPERAMYRNDRREGHDSIGVTEPASDFYLAEGCTAQGFTTFALVQNPNDTPTEVTLTYMTPDGAVQGDRFTMDPDSRKTVRVNSSLPEKDVSIVVHGSQPIVAERAMYWDSGNGEACHDSVGLAGPHAEFYLPDGQTSEGRETFTLVQNPNPVEVRVEIAYLTEGGQNNRIFEDTIPASSRRTYDMADGGVSGRASVRVRSLTEGAFIIVERAMYWNNRSAGTDTIGGYSD